MPTRTRAILAVCLLALMTACASTTATPRDVEGPATSQQQDVPDETPVPTTTPAASAPTPSKAAGGCVDETVIAAIEELGHGNMDTDPSRAEIAVALELLDLAGAEADARDSMVIDLRKPITDGANAPFTQSGMVMQTQFFLSQVGLSSC